ncbi:C-factor [Cytospora mali]|uniref:C-factor n=1 Tax=Cytospora mali TaxID=578113 RepID=A0A194UXY6_CYTMA|nr:C-factor [Valsa mali var. pyri (nom. inval.)]
MPQEEHPTSQSKLPTVLITGAFSGLGRAFFQHFVKRSNETPDGGDGIFRVVGIDIQPWMDENGNAHNSHAHGRRSVYVQLDVTSPAEELGAFSRRWIGDETPLFLVIHCAGVRGLVPAVNINMSDDVATAETLDAMDAATMMRTFEINVIGTFNILTAVLPNLRLAAHGNLNARVVIMSSRMGSIAANDKGGGYAYRASKAALNAVVRSMSIDVPSVSFALVHPGRVETGLVSVKEDGAFSCEESLETLLPLIDGLGDGHLKSGCFVDRFGKEILW